MRKTPPLAALLIASLALAADDQVLVSTTGDGVAWTSVPDCDTAATSKLLYDTATNTFSCGTDQTGAGGPECIYIPLWSWVAAVGNTTTTTRCVATTNLTNEANRGEIIFVDMDVYTHAKLHYFGNVTGAQTGTVTVKLRDIAAATDDISTSFNSGTTCVDRSSATTDLTSKTGVVGYAARIGDSNAADDPALSTVSVQFCTGSF